MPTPTAGTSINCRAFRFKRCIIWYKDLPPKLSKLEWTHKYWQQIGPIVPLAADWAVDENGCVHKQTRSRSRSPRARASPQ